MKKPAKNWKNYIKTVLGFSLPTLSAISTVWHQAEAGGLPPSSISPHFKPEPMTFSLPTQPNGPEIFIGHRSHSSHSSHYSSSYGGHASHSSHSSHYSSSYGGSYTPRSSGNYVPSPAPTPDPVPPSLNLDTTPSNVQPSPSSEITPPVNAPKSQQTPQGKGSTKKTDLIIVIMRAQVELKNRGYYDGPIDGILSDETKKALLSFQTAQNLTSNGRLSDETLSKLGIIY